MLQPYLIAPEIPEHYLDLRFTIPSGIALDEAQLALEEPEQACVRLNGQAVDTTPTGWFVDRDIKTVALPPLVKGENILEIRVPIGKRTNLEAFYLLGNFGVDVRGVGKTIVPPPETLGFGSVTGLPSAIWRNTFMASSLPMTITLSCLKGLKSDGFAGLPFAMWAL